MRNARALRNLFAFLGAVVFVLAIIGMPIGATMQPAEQGGLLLIIDAVVALIAVVLFCCSAVLAAIIELDPRSP